MRDARAAAAWCCIIFAFLTSLLGSVRNVHCYGNENTTNHYHWFSSVLSVNPSLWQGPNSRNWLNVSYGVRLISNFRVSFPTIVSSERNPPPPSLMFRRMRKMKYQRNCLFSPTPNSFVCRTEELDWHGARNSFSQLYTWNFKFDFRVKRFVFVSALFKRQDSLCTSNCVFEMRGEQLQTKRFLVRSELRDNRNV